MYASFNELAKEHNLTPEQQRQELIECYYNVHKDVHGFKPRHMDFDAMTIEQMVADIEEMSRMEPESYLDEADSFAFEARMHEENVQAMMACGAEDRRTAERWARQSM